MSSAFVELLASINDFTSKMATVRGELAQTKTTAEEAGGGWQKFGGLAQAGMLVAGAAILEVGKKSIEMADEFEKSHARLVTSLENTGTSFGQWKNQIQAADDQGAKFGYNAAQIEDALSRLETAVKDPVKAIKDLGVAEDIAAARGIDLNTASQLVARASNGSYTALVKLGVVTKSQAKDFKDGAEAVNFLGKAFAGQAQAQADTFGGKMAALKATLQDLEIHLGNILVPILSGFAGELARVAGFLERNKWLIDALTVSFNEHGSEVKKGQGAWDQFVGGVEHGMQSGLRWIGILHESSKAHGDAAKAALGSKSALDNLDSTADATAADYQNLAGATDKWVSESDRAKAAAKAEKEEVKNLKDALDDLIGRHVSAEQASINLADGFANATDKFTAQEKAAKDLGPAQDKVTAASDRLKAAEDALAVVHEKVTAGKLKGTAAADALKAGEDRVTLATDALHGSQGGLTKAQDAQTGAVAKASLGWDTNRAALDLSTQSHRDGAKAVSDLIQQILGNITAMKNEGDTNQHINDITQENINKLHGLMIQGGLTEGQIATLNQQLGLTPRQVATALDEALNTHMFVEMQIRDMNPGGTLMILRPNAQGGVVTGPALAGEEPGQTEYVIPLNPAYRSRALGLYADLGSKLMAAGGVVRGNASQMGVPLAAEYFNYAAVAASMAKQALTPQLQAAVASAVQANFALSRVPAGFGPGGPSGPISGDVGSWLAQAIAITGAPMGWMSALARMVQLESGGDPLSANRTAAGLAAGLPEGLLQTIPATFGAYALPGHGNIWNPVDNAIAAIRYIESRYGSPFNIRGVFGGGYQGYDVPFGTAGIVPPGVTMAVNTTGMNEYISRTPPNESGGAGGGGGDLVLQIDGQTLARVAGPQIRAWLYRRGRQTVNLAMS